MNLSGYQDFIRDKKFSSDLQVQYQKQPEVADKMDYLKSHLAGKKVIDIGFADHLSLIDERLKNNGWIHAHFRSWSTRIIGVDIDPQAVEHVKNKFNYNDVYCHDITSSQLLEPILKESWDYVVMSEVLEHIPNPALFLSKIKENYGKHVGKLIITVPNAFGTITLRSVFNNVERINSDHKFWFTPYTLAKVVTAAGLEVEEFRLCNSYYKLNFWERMLVRRSPLFHHTLAMVVKL